MSPLAASLLHSLWLAGLAWLALVSGLKCLPAQAATWRYRLSLGAVALVVLAWLGTWALLGNPPAPAPSVSAPSPTAQALPQSIPAANAPVIVPVLNAGETRVAQSFPWQDWALIAWKAGVVLGFCRIFTSVASARKLTRAAEPVRDPRWLEALDHVCAQFGNRAAIGIKACREIASPMVIGLLRPTILIPASLLTGAPPEALRAVLGHEIAHVIRWDYLVNLLQMGTEALLFFNPFVWALNRIVRREREACCDALASGGFSHAAEYAEALVWWTRAAVAPPSGAAVAMQGPKNGHWLRDRILRLLNPADIPHSRAGWFGAGGAVFAVGLFFVALAGGVRFTVKELTARERVELIRQKAVPFVRQNAEPRENPQKRAFGGVISDEAGRPVAGASWRMLSDFSIKSGTADAFGRFSGILPNELLRLRVSAEGFAPAALKFEPSVSAETIDVKLNPGIPFAVRCEEATGKPVPGVTATLDYAALGARRTALTGTDGVARFEHQPEGEFAELSLSAPGFRAMRFSRLQVTPKPAPAPFSLAKEAPFSITVVDELDGSPVSGVLLRVHETWPENFPFPAWSNNGRKTDATGRAELEGLAPGTMYDLTAQGERRGVRFRINPGREASLTLRLPRERRLKLKIINLDLPKKEIGVQVDHKESENSSHASFVEIPVVNGTAETELRGLRPEAVDLFVERQWCRSPELKNEVTEFTIDYAKIKPLEKSRVVLNFDPGFRGAPPTGSVWINWEMPGQRTGAEGLRAAIVNGKAEFEAPAGAVFWLSNSETLMGAVVDNQKRYSVQTNPTVMTIPVKAAGLIRAKVLEKDGSLAKMVFVSAWSGPGFENHRSIKNSASHSDQDTREWYASGPIELGWKSYRVIAENGNRFVISEPFKVNARTPVRDVVVTLPEPLKREIRLVDTEGRPASGVRFSMRCEHKEFGTLGGESSVQADADGRASIWIGKDAQDCTYWITPESGTYLRKETPLTLDHGLPTGAVIEKGQRLWGRIVDDKTGAGVPWVRARWIVFKHRVIWRHGQEINETYDAMSSQEITPDASGRFEFDNAPAEKVFLQVSIPFGKKIRDGNNSLNVVPGEKEVVIYLDDDPPKEEPK